MNPREKTYTLAIGGLVGVAALFFIGRGVVYRPIQERNSQIKAARAQLLAIAKERKDYLQATEYVKQLAAKSLSTNLDQASARSGEMLSRLILQSGLSEANFSRSPFSRRLHNTLRSHELGWSVQGEGRLSNVVDLLFLAQESPYLHRLEGLNLAPADNPGDVRVRFRYATLVIHPSPPADLAELDHPYTLYGPQRRRYDELVVRDLLRPYIKKPPPPRAPGSPPGEGLSPGTTPEMPGPESFKVVSLSEWAGEPEVHVRDTVNQTTLRFKAGDALAGGTIVMVDYRPLPLPGNEFLKSFSRVIIRIGTEYWAVERGKTLADKYRLSLEQLPANLSKL